VGWKTREEAKIPPPPARVTTPPVAPPNVVTSPKGQGVLVAPASVVQLGEARSHGPGPPSSWPLPGPATPGIGSQSAASAVVAAAPNAAAHAAAITAARRVMRLS
jgi:hypothetical protein